MQFLIKLIVKKSQYMYMYINHRTINPHIDTARTFKVSVY